MTKILDGKRLAKSIEEESKKEIALSKLSPKLAIILVGDDEASKIYVNKKKKAGDRIGVNVDIFHYAENDNSQDIIDKIKKLNNDVSFHGIIVQMPLPQGFDKQRIIEAVSPEKDVDGAHPLNWGRLAYTIKDVTPCTAFSVMNILHYYQIPIQSKEVVVVGKSELVGKPLSILLMNEDATLTVVHRKTKNLKKHTQNADILISAAGQANLITEDMIKKGAVVVDVGINRIGGKVVGDVDFESVKNKASAITPVPGGVGPVTVAQLIKNVVDNARRLGIDT